MTTLAFVLQTPDVTRAWLSQVASAVAAQLARDVAPAWGLVAPRVDTRVYEAMTDVPSGALPLILLPDSDVAGYLGYHDETSSGVVYARVFTHGQALADISRAISHEAIEAIVDPSCNRWVEGPDELWYALEAVDPVEADGYPIDLDGIAVQVSDFVLPAWFDPTTPAEAPTDHLSLVKGAWQIRPSGYAIVLDAGSTVSTKPPGAACTPAKRHPAARTARRRRGLG